MYGIDNILYNACNVLLQELGWLNNAYGRTERRERDYNGRKMRVQCAFKGTENALDEYVEMSPDSTLGNFSFFVLRDPTAVDWQANRQKWLSQPFSLIFWFDMNSVFSSEGVRDIEAVRLQILSVLDKCRSVGSHLSVSAIYEDTQNVWRNIVDIKDLSMWQPYCGLRFDGSINYLEDCL